MAINNGNKLTKYESATTVVTAAAMNKIYGGLYGTAEGDALAVTDPLVAGHIHDGQHIDGHAQKVDLVDHVTGQLRNSNLADEAVTHRNVKGFLDQSSAIPEFEVIDGDTYYYLDLSDLRSEIPASVGTGDKSSIVGGEDNLASADRSGVFGGKNNWASGIESVVLGGKDGIAAGQKSSVSGGEANNITSFGDYSFAGGGLSNSISGTKSSILAGESNLLSGSKSTILGGLTNSVSSDISSIITGESNTLTSLSTYSLIGSGKDNNVAATKSAILTGDQNQIYNGFSTPEKSAILSGSLNEVYNNESAIISGTGNLLGADKSIIGSGDTNQIYSESSGILSGVENQITGDAAVASIIGGGGKAASGNLIDLSGIGARAPGAFYGGAFIGGGIENEISGAYADYGVITGGKSNFIDGSGSGTDYAFIGGGQDNEVSGSWGVVAGGSTNVASSIYSTISGGSANTASGDRSVIAGGSANTASDLYTVVSGGNNNTVSAQYSNIGGGYINAVSGDYSSIQGGRENTISSDYSNINGGRQNTITSNFYSNIGGGRLNQNLSDYSTISGGQSNIINSSANYSSISGGGGNVVDSTGGGITNGLYSKITSTATYGRAGGQSSVSRNYGEDVYSSGSFNPLASYVGDSQRVFAVWYSVSSDAVAKEIFLNGAMPGDPTFERYVLSDFSVLKFTIDISAISSVYDGAVINITGGIKRGSGVGSTALIGVPVVTVDADPALVGATAAVSADTTNGSLRLDITGIALTNIKWSATMMGSLVRYV